MAGPSLKHSAKASRICDEQKRLSLKYGLRWLAQVLPVRAAAAKRLSAGVINAVICHEDAPQVVGWSEFRPLHVGADLMMEQGKCTVESLPDGCPTGLHFVPTSVFDVGLAHPRYMTLQFVAPTRVYILLPRLTNEPSWLRDMFTKLRDAYNGKPQCLQVRFHVTLASYFWFLLGMCLHEYVHQDLTMWESNQVYQPLDQLMLSACGRTDFTDTTYMVAFRQELAGGGCAQLPSGIKESLAYEAWWDRIARAVCRDRLADVLQLLDPECWNSEWDVRPNISRIPFTPRLHHHYSSRKLNLEHLLSNSRRPSLDNLFSSPPTTLLASTSPGGVSSSAASPATSPRAPSSRRISFWSGAPPVPPAAPPPLVMAVDVAAGNDNINMLVLLVAHSGCSLTYYALQYLVRHFDTLKLPTAEWISEKAIWIPDDACHGEALLLHYLCHHPAPLSTVAALLRALYREVKRRANTPSQAIQRAVERFRAVQLALVAQLPADYSAMTHLDRLEHGLPAIDLLLRPAVALQARPAAHDRHQDASVSPASYPLQLTGCSPLDVAFEGHDMAFVTSPWVQDHMRKRWIGQELSRQTALSSLTRLSPLNCNVGFVFLRNMGLCGELPSLIMTMKLWHTCAFTSTAFFNSPRGRWILSCLSKVAFLALYTLFMLRQDTCRWVVHAMLVCTLGNMVGARSISRLLMNDLLAMPLNTVLLAVTVAYLLSMYGAMDGYPNVMLAAQLTQAGCSVLVWSFLLRSLVPLNAQLGPLLRTMYHMLQELLTFALPFSLATAGFTMSLYCVFRSDLPAYGSIPATALSLFQAFLGNFDYSAWDELSSVHQVYGQVILTLYLVVGGVMASNLLVAIITYRYRPDDVQEESVFDMSLTIDRFTKQVDSYDLSAPLGILLRPFAWLPTARRKPIKTLHFAVIGMLPLDGVPTIAGKSGMQQASKLLPAGRDEVPHLVYLLTLHPLLLLLTNVLFYMHAPYCILYFAFHGHTKLTAHVLQHFPRLQPLLDPQGGHSKKPDADSASQWAPPSFSRSNTNSQPPSPGLSRSSSFQQLPSGAGGADSNAEEPPVSSTARSDAGRLALLWRAVLCCARTVVFLVLGVLLYVGVFGVVLVTGVTSVYSYVGHILLSVYFIAQPALAPLATKLSARLKRQSPSGLQQQPTMAATAPKPDFHRMSASSYVQEADASPLMSPVPPPPPPQPSAKPKFLLLRNKSVRMASRLAVAAVSAVANAAPAMTYDVNDMHAAAMALHMGHRQLKVAVAQVYGDFGYHHEACGTSEE